jgi:hypothetical protein
MTRKLGLPLILVVALAVSCAAWAEDGKAGSTYLDVFAIGVGAAPSAMAAYTAAPGDLWSLAYNPAGLYNVDRISVGVSVFEWVEDTSYNYVGLAMPTGGGALGIGVAYFDLGGVPITDIAGEETGEVAEADNLGVTAGYGIQWPTVCELSIGISGHVIRGALHEDSATALGLNLGVLYAMMHEQVNLGASVRNLGTRFKFDEEEDEQTMTLGAGLSYMPDLGDTRADVIIGLDVQVPKNRDPAVAVGGEVWFVDMLALRAGYRTGVDMGNLSFGAGFRISDFQLDYTYTDHESQGSSNRLSISVGLRG